jgi:hypothetical protein
MNKMVTWSLQRNGSRNQVTKHEFQSWKKSRSINQEMYETPNMGTILEPRSLQTKWQLVDIRWLQ